MAPKRVLVVDDEESVRQILSTVLRGEGYEVAALESFDEVKAQLPSFDADTIILDVLLPGASGLDILKYLNEQGIETPVIIITGAPDIQSARESLQHGAYDYIAKPFSLEVLRRAVRRAINQKELIDARRDLEERERLHADELAQQVRQRTLELERRNLALATLNRVDAILASSLAIEHTLQAALNETLKPADATLGAVYLQSEHDLGLAALASLLANPPQLPEHLDSSLVERMSGEVSILAVQEAPQPFREALAGAGLSKVALFRLMSKQESIGLLFVAADSSAAFDDATLSLLSSVATQLAVAVQNARLFEEATARRQHTEAIIQNMAEGVLVLDRRGRVAGCNAALRSLLGLPDEQDLLGREVSSFEAASDPGLQALWEICSTLHRRSAPHGSTGGRSSRAPVQTEVTLPAPINRILTIVTSELEYGPSGRPGLVRVVRDITQEREVERTKSEFISMISHELRTPLFYIKGFVELMLQGKAEDKTVQREFLGIIREQTDHLNHLIEDMLDTSRFESGLFALKREVIPLGDLLLQSAADAEGMALQVGVEIQVEDEGALPEAIGDYLRLKQVMMNLISNAIKFSEPGQVVTLRSIRQNDEAWVQVEDQGPGIPEKYLPHLFDKFFQADSSSTRTKGGVGLGLYVSAQLIERMDGRIWAESELGSGSRFTFALPLRGSDPEASE